MTFKEWWEEEKKNNNVGLGKANQQSIILEINEKNQEEENLPFFYQPLKNNNKEIVALLMEYANNHPIELEVNGKKEKMKFIHSLVRRLKIILKLFDD